MLYNATLLIKADIDNIRYIQYFENRLNPKKFITLTEFPKVGLGISKTVGVPSVFNETYIPEAKQYVLKTNKVMGENYIFFSVPEEFDFSIYDQGGVNITDDLTIVSETLYRTPLTNTTDNIYFKIVLI
jgi:hypothetical protein